VVENLETAFLSLGHLEEDTIAEIRAISSTAARKRPVAALTVEEDVVMDDAASKGSGDQDTLRQASGSRKGKTTAQSAGDESVASEAQQLSDARPTGLKRGPQDSPTRVEVKPKRSRTLKKKQIVSDDEEGVDLSGYTFAEDTEVDPVLVPQVEGKVRLRLTLREGSLTGW
jgi:hypothetical protein